MSADPLAGVRLLGLDTAPIIYLIEQHAEFGPPVVDVAASRRPSGLLLQ